LTVSVKAYKDEQEDGKSDQGSSTITHEGKGYSNDRNNPDGHANVDEDMKKEYGSNAIGIGSAKSTSLPFCHADYPEQHEKIQAQKDDASCKSKSFTNGTENKISPLLRNKIVPRLCSFHQALAPKTS